MENIDFVVTWVDGNDAEWLAERAQYMPTEINTGNAENRFRDWGLMKYWFRGIEKYAPWVNNVYFVTWGHYPDWLNLKHPKLKLVKHTDYIPQEYLPTYNTNVIELNVHRIKELSERFVLFNDDTFLIDAVNPDDFFIDNLPCEVARMNAVNSSDPRNVFPHMLLNNIAIINKHFRKRTVLRTYFKKFYTLKYGVDLIRNILLAPFKYFSSFHDTHLPASHLKITFDEVWEAEPEVLHECCTHRFREMNDVTSWLMKWWRFCKGEFAPRSIKWGKCFEIGQDIGMIDAIKKQEYKAICVNDSNPDLDFEHYQKALTEAFEMILSEKCSFEL